MKFYTLEHVYVVVREDDEIEEIKHIGIFLSQNKAIDAINQLKYKPGFIDHSIDCFQIHEVLLDMIGWSEGFIKWKDAF